jgi:2-hydroxycyclohexanecarboxyl-CoA dehydrogenase
MDLDLDEKSVVVTGGASNIGRAITLAFAAEGANVTLGDLDETQAARVAATAAEGGRGRVEVVRADVTERADVERLVESARRAFGAVDVLVNGVGWDDLKFFGQTTPELWDKIIRVNFLSVLNCTRAVLDEMVARQGGAIVSISSDASRQGEPREAVYGGMKAAVNSFMKTIAKEFGRSGIRCNVVCPGVTLPEHDEELGANSLWVRRGEIFSDEQLEKLTRALPLRKLGRPADIANAVVFLASQRVAGHITGQVLSVSGGYSMIG